MNIPLKRLLPLGLLALLILLIICFIGDISRIQGKLRNNSHEALIAQGCNFDKENISFSGRNGTLSGSIPEQDKDFILSTVSEVRGVHKVKGDFNANAGSANVGCSSRVAAVTPALAPPTSGLGLAPTLTAAGAAALAPALAPRLINRPAPVLASSVCRVLSAQERAALQNELNVITSTLPEERFAIGNLSATPALNNHLESAVAVLSKDEYKNASVNIVGHTESALLPIYNECLSSGRADSVKQFLIANGINANCLSVSAAGGNRALASSDTAEGRKLNRRIEFLVQEVQ